MNQNSMDMTVGNPMQLLIAFSVPTLIGNVLNQVYSITDSIIVGRYLGQTAFAAVGSTMPIILLLAALMIGVNIGVSILLSQCFGRQDLQMMRRTFSNSLYFGTAISVFMAVVGPLLSNTILSWMGTPASVMGDADAYLRVAFISSICPMVYFLFSCAFRGMGDSKTVLYCLIISVAANIALDYWFVAVLGFGVVGSAWATALAQAGASVFAAIMLWVKFPQMRLSARDFKPNFSILGSIGKLATPIALQTGFNNLGSIVAQAGVNLFGEVAMAAYTAGNRIGTLSIMPAETIGGSLSIYTGQNYGAKNRERIEQGVQASLKLALWVSVVIGAVLLLGGRKVTGLFLENPSEELLHITQWNLIITAVPGILAGIMFVYQQVLRGMGHANAAMVGGLMQLAVKIAVVILGAWVFHNLNVIWLAWPASFVAGTVVPYIIYRRNRNRPIE